MTTNVGICMTTNVSIYMITNVGMHMTTNVAVIWPRISQWYDYTCRSHMITNVALIWLRMSRLYDCECRSYRLKLWSRDDQCEAEFSGVSFFRIQWFFFLSISGYPRISRMSHFSRFRSGMLSGCPIFPVFFHMSRFSRMSRFFRGIDIILYLKKRVKKPLTASPQSFACELCKRRVT